MAVAREIVITGVGVVSPIGVGSEAFWSSLVEGRSGVRPLRRFDSRCLPAPFGGEVVDFDPKHYVRPRKSLKVMCRDIQLAFAAADLACRQAGFDRQRPEPDRLGVVFGAELMPCEPPEMVNAYRRCIVGGQFDFSRWGDAAMEEMFPLWMLKYLPNMPACHVAIAHDARGPNNSLTVGEVSSLVALQEAARVIDRGGADAMIAGGASSRIHPTLCIRSEVLQVSHRKEDPASASRPFDAHRDGLVNGEGAGAYVLETRQSAEARGATILARLLGFAGTFQPHRHGEPCGAGAIRNAITLALRDAGLTPSEVGHVNANGMSTTLDDRIEAEAIRGTLGDVPVTAPKSYFGHLGAGSGAVEMAASVLAFSRGCIPPTLNYQQPDPRCPIHVVAGQPAPLDKPTAVVLNHAQLGQAAAVVLAAP